MTVGIWVLGVAMTNFGRFPDRDDVDLAFEACSGALADADIAMSQVEILAAGSTMNRTGIGQEVQKQLGQYGIPVYNVTNACATGATALRTVCVALAAGEAEVGLAVGAEQMGKKGLLGMTSRWPDTYTAQGRSGAVAATEGVLGTNLMPALFSHAAMDYVRRYPNTGEEVFAEIAEKNHANSVNNPFAMYQKAYTLDEILASPVVTSPNTVLMCGPTCDGAAAAVVVTDDFLRRLGPAARARAVRIAASILTSDPWSEGSEVVPDLNTLSALAAKRAYLQAGSAPAISIWSSCMIVSPPRSFCITRTFNCAGPARQPTSSIPAQRGVTDAFRSIRRADWCPRGTHSVRRGWPISSRSRLIFEVKQVTVRSMAPVAV